MAKIKTHRGAAKRFKVTASGKIKRSKANRRHLLTGKSSKRTKQLRKEGEVSCADFSSIKKLIPYM
jgi:large subunit ribosomal protein L35